MKSGIGRASLVLALAVAVTAGCSSKTEDSGTKSESGVKTGAGISHGTIRLGVLTDLSGSFAPIGKEISQAEKVYWDDKNAHGGVCGKFPVEVDVRDSVYNVQNTVSLYSDMHKDVLAFANVLGSAHTLALKDQLTADDMLVVAHGQGVELLGLENVIETGASFDIEGANGMGYMLESGALKDGDTVGHIHLEGTYGDAVAAGVQKFADDHHLKVHSTQVAPTTTDLTPAITDLAGKHIDLLVFSGTPPQLASAVGAATAAGLDIPVLASTPTWTSGLLKTPAAEALKKNVTVVFPAAPFEVEAAKAFRELYVKAYPQEDPSLQIILELSEMQALDAVLEKACADGDLTRAGVMKAKRSIGTVKTDGITPELDFSEPAKPATAKEFVTKVADVPGGLQLVKADYVSDEGQALFDAK